MYPVKRAGTGWPSPVPPRARVPFAGDGRTGDLLIVPDSRHALAAIEDSAILLTVSKAAYPGSP